MAGLGLLGHVGFAKESVGGTAVSATNYIKATEESLRLEKDYYEPITISGRIMTPDDGEGVHRVAGGLVFPFHPVDGGFFLAGVLTEARTVTEIEAGELYRHSFVPPSTSQWSSTHALQPFTFEINRDIGSSHQYTGCNIDSLELSIVPNQELRCTANIIGTDHGLIERTTPSFTASPAEFLAFDTASLSVGGSARADFESFTLRMANALEGVPTLANKRTVSKIRRNGYLEMEIQASLEFQDATDYLAFVNETEQAFKITLTRAASFQLEIDLPRVKYRSFPIGTGGRERNLVEFMGRCFYHVGSQTNCEINLTTTSSYF